MVVIPNVARDDVVNVISPFIFYREEIKRYIDQLIRRAISMMDMNKFQGRRSLVMLVLVHQLGSIGTSSYCSNRKHHCRELCSRRQQGLISALVCSHINLISAFQLQLFISMPTRNPQLVNAKPVTINYMSYINI